MAAHLGGDLEHMSRSPADLFSVAGLVAVVTGGSSGIGQAMAGTLALAGASVVLVARRTDPLRTAANDLRAAGCKAAWVSADLSDQAGVTPAAEQAAAPFGDTQAEAWSRAGVCVNAIAPGFVRTPLTEAVFADPERSTAMAHRTMVGRNGELDDFQGVTLFLASRASDYVTGQTIFVDGGFSST